MVKKKLKFVILNLATVHQRISPRWKESAWRGVESVSYGRLPPPNSSFRTGRQPLGVARRGNHRGSPKSMHRLKTWIRGSQPVTGI